MNILSYLATDLNTVLFIVCILGLVVGSFLNVVIHRLPIMMEREWQVHCTSILKISTPVSEPFNLNQPRSHCPECGHQLTILENIPLLSYLWQRGQCTVCHHPISIHYPLVELLAAILAIITAWQFGFGWSLLGALAITWALLACSMIDFYHQLLPDSIVLPFLWMGLVCNLFGLYTPIESSVIGAIAGYLSLWSVYKIFKFFTGKEGMGYGDFKLLAMLGAWQGWQVLPLIILISSLIGAVVGIILIIKNKQDKNVPIPFGPFLAIAGWITLLWGNSLTSTYFL